jgi:hypothetical protein
MFYAPKLSQVHIFAFQQFLQFSRNVWDFPNLFGHQINLQAFVSFSEFKSKWKNIFIGPIGQRALSSRAGPASQPAQPAHQDAPFFLLAPSPSSRAVAPR